MKESEELKHLLHIRSLVTETAAATKKIRRFSRWAEAFGGVCLFVAAILVFLTGSHPIIAVGIAFVGGIAIGLASYYSAALKQIPVLVSHISAESVIERIEEIET